ncbi:MAG: hypothetical protein IJH96_01255 [Ruminococcus sp.]|nr:hypothetical protein [Ruminococcus sp.]
MSKWTLCLFMTLVLVYCSVFSVYAEDEPAEQQLNIYDEEYTDEVWEELTTEMSTTKVQPTSETVIPADYPALTVNAISNFFPNATAEYSAGKKQVEVTYSMRCSMNMMCVQWYLYYDKNIFSVSKELNMPADICSVIGDKAAVTFNEGEISYCSSNINLYDFSTKEVPFVKMIFDVKEINPEEPVITKFDLTVDVLCASELDPTTRKSDVEKEKFFVSHSELRQTAIDSVRLSRNTILTHSNFVQATTAPQETVPPVTDEHGNIIPATTDEAKEKRSQPSTSAPGEVQSTGPIDPAEPPTEPLEPPPLGTGSAGYACICLGALLVATTILFLMRKKEILY